MKTNILVMAFLLFGLTLWAQEEHLKLNFDFKHVLGTTVTDAVSGVNAQLMSTAKVVKMGSYNVLDLGNSTGYLNMTAEAGKVLAAQGDHTLSAFYFIDNEATLAGNGFFLWSFSTSAACGATSGAYSTYRLNAQRIALSPGGYQNEIGYSVGTAAAKGKWMHVAYTQQGATGKLYIDGVLKNTTTNMPLNSTLYASTKPLYCWLGRAPFSGDNYLKQTLVADFCLYGAALSADQVRTLSNKTSDLEYAYTYGTPGDFTQLGTAIAEVKTFLSGTATVDYAPNALAELHDLLTIAQVEYDARLVSQSIIDARVETLQKTLLHVKSTLDFKMKAPTQYQTGTQGFRHPGGLHTEADFARIKKALADGNTRIMQAWQLLCANEYAQASIATWPVEIIFRGGSGNQNYMNVARGAAMAYQNALRWKIGGTTTNADAAVRILMAWAKGNKYVSGDTNLSLAAGIYGYQLAQAAELMRDYEGWSREDFEVFKRYMMQTWYPATVDFLRRRHDTWQNASNASLGQRPGHYWSNWGLCNVLCLMSIGILCDDVHIYNQGISFYKYDHVGTFKDRSKNTVILNDGCNEFIGNLVPVVLPDQRGPFGYLGQMQESGRDQGHALMALGLAIDICQVGYNQGDDLFALMDDRLAAGLEHVAALNFGGVSGASLPWITYNYADCRGSMGAGWAQGAPNEGGLGGHRPFWDRALGYYEGIRGVSLPYARKASATVGIDRGGGNYGQTSGGFDHLGFSTLTSYRPKIDATKAPVVLSGDMVYKGDTLKHQSNLGGLKYRFEVCSTKAIPSDGADITLIPQLPDSIRDNGQWQWNTGETTRQLTVKANRSYLYRVTYTADNGVQSEQAFAIAVAGDCQPDVITPEITVDGVLTQDTITHVLYGSSLVLYTGNSTGWTNDYYWDNGVKGNSTITVPVITTDRTYTCQYINQGGYVNEQRFHISVDKVQPYIIIGGAQALGNQVQVLGGTTVTLRLLIPAIGHPDSVLWQDGTKGTTHTLSNVQQDTQVNVTYQGITYTFFVQVKESRHSYYSLLTAEKGYSLVASAEELSLLAPDNYFVLASDEADLLMGLNDAPLNGNKALFFQTPVDPLTDVSKVFTLEPYGDAFCMRNIDFDGLLLQTEWDRPDQLRTNDQALACEWTRFLLANDNGAWTVENGKYPGNFLGLWVPANGYRHGEEIGCNKTGNDVAQLQLFAIPKTRFHADYLAGTTAGQSKDATVLMTNPSFAGKSGFGWTLTGKWGNQRYNGAAEVWHSSGFDIAQTINGLPDGAYTLTCQVANGEGQHTGYLFARSGNETKQALVTQSCSDSNFDAERDKMASNPTYGKLSLDINVTGNTLTLGIKEPSDGTTWLVFDNFTLTYRGNASSGVDKVHHATTNAWNNDAIYDLQGRKVVCPTKGFYIMQGKIFLIK